MIKKSSLINLAMYVDSNFLVRRPYQCDIVVIRTLCSLPNEKRIRARKNVLMICGRDFFTDVLFFPVKCEV